MPTHQIDSPDSFHLRQPVLEAMSSLRGRWKVVEGGKALEVDLGLSDYSPHERDVIEFAINPLVTAPNIFGGLDRAVQQALATAIYQIYK